MRAHRRVWNRVGACGPRKRAPGLLNGFFGVRISVVCGIRYPVAGSGRERRPATAAQAHRALPLVSLKRNSLKLEATVSHSHSEGVGPAAVKYYSRVTV